MPNLCTTGDGKPARARGLCVACYARATRAGAELPPRRLGEPGEGDRLVIRMPREFRVVCSLAAYRAGLEESQWWRDAASEKLIRDGRKKKE